MKRDSHNASDPSVLIIDSRPMFRKGLSSCLLRLLKSASILEANHSKDSFEVKSEVIFIFGGDLADTEIIVAIRNLRKTNVDAKIVLYDYRHSLRFLLSFFRESLNGYLPGNFGDKELEECLQDLNSNRLYVNNEAAYQMLLSNLSGKSHKKLLSSLEDKVAHYLLKGLGTSQIAGIMDRRPSTISTVKASIFKKTKVDNVIDLAKLMV